MEKKIDTIRNLTIINAIVSAALIICMIVFVIHVNNINTRLTDMEVKGGVSLQDEAAKLPPGTVIEDHDTIHKISDEAVKAINDALTKNTYFSIAMSSSEDMDMLLTNTKGEAVYQDAKGQTMVYLDNGDSVYFADNVYYGTDRSVIHQIKSVFENAEAAGATFLETANNPLEDGSGTIVEYCVDIHGWDNLLIAMKSLGDDYSKDLVEAMKASIELSELNVDVENVHTRYSIAYVNGKLSGMGCFYYFGKDAIGAWSTCIQDWLVAGMFEVYDWNIPQEFKDFKWSDISNKSPEELGGMLDVVYNEIQNMLKKFDEDNGYSDNTSTGGIEWEVSNPVTDTNSGDTESNTGSETAENTENTEDTKTN